MAPEPTRPELDARATELGLDPDDYSNKDEVAKAIADAEAAQENPPADGGDEVDVHTVVASLEDLELDERVEYIENELSDREAKAILVHLVKQAELAPEVEAAIDDLDDVERPVTTAGERIDVDELDEYDRDDLVALTPLTFDEDVYPAGGPIPEDLSDEQLEVLVRQGHVGSA